MLLALGLVAGCGKQDGGGDDATPAPQEKTNAEDPTEPNDVGPSTPVTGGVSPQVSEFVRTDVDSGQGQTVRKDYGQALLVDGTGKVAVAGVTRSTYVRKPSLGGDLLFTRYSFAEGWSDRPVQVGVIGKPVPPPVDGTPPPPPTAMPNPLLAVKGGRLFDSGKAMVLGEFYEADARFGESQLFLDETKTSTQPLFLAVFSADNSMMRTARFGLSGVNTIVGTAKSRAANSVYVAGATDSGLMLKRGLVETQPTYPSNYVVEIAEDGSILRSVFWNATVNSDAEVIGGIASNDKFAYTAVTRGGKKVIVRGIEEMPHVASFATKPEIEVCAAAAQGAVEVKVASIDASETEVVVAVDIKTVVATTTETVPCVEVFEVKPTGVLVARRESLWFSGNATADGATRANFVAGSKVLMSRTRADTNHDGQGYSIATFLFERPMVAGGYESQSWKLNRPKDWYGSDDVNHLSRNLVRVVWPKGSAHEDVVWMLSNDQTVKTVDAAGGTAVESLIHLGSYRAISKPTKEP